MNNKISDYFNRAKDIWKDSKIISRIGNGSLGVLGADLLYAVSQFGNETITIIPPDILVAYGGGTPDPIDTFLLVLPGIYLTAEGFLGAYKDEWAPIAGYAADYIISKSKTLTNLKNQQE